MTKQKIITTTPNQQILWSMVYLNTIPIRNLSHRIKNGNRENRQPVEPKSVKQHKATKIKLKKFVGGNCPRGAIVRGAIVRGVIVLLPSLA